MAVNSQLIKENKSQGGYSKVYPKTFIDAIKDRETGQTLSDILNGFNMYFLSYVGSKEQTRLQVPSILRRTGLWVTYVMFDKTIVVEWYASDDIGDDAFKKDSNWRKGNNILVGDITISSNGNWVINGVDSGIKVQGEPGITPMLRVNNNKLEVSYNEGSSYSVISDYIAAWFRWSDDNRIQISRTNSGSDWQNLSEQFENNLYIKDYADSVGDLPSEAAIGSIYMVGTTAPYTMYVKTSSGWVDNGQYTSIAAGVVQELGDSATVVMSQKAICDATGLNDYPTFSEDSSYATGDVVNYNGKLYQFLTDHAAGVWTGGDVEKTDLKKITSTALSKKLNKYSDKEETLGDVSQTFRICDSVGNVIAKIDKSGLNTIKLLLKNSSIEEISDDNALVISDKYGNVILKIDENGVDYLGKVTTEYVDDRISSLVVSDKVDVNLPYDINMVINYGQSNASQGTIVSPMPEMYNLLCFAKSGFSVYNGSTTDMSQMTEEEINSYLGGSLVNYNRGIALQCCYFPTLSNMWIKTLLQDAKLEYNNEFGYRLCGQAPGRATNILDLSNTDGVLYKRLLIAVKYAMNYAKLQGCTFNVAMMTWMQGEGDKQRTEKWYYDMMWVMFSNLNHDIKEITGQDNDVLFVNYQMASGYEDNGFGPTKALAQIAIDEGEAPKEYVLESDASKCLKDSVSLLNRDNVQFGSATYQINYKEKGSDKPYHFDNIGIHYLGAMYALQGVKSINEGKPIKPLHPLSHTIINNKDGSYTINIKMEVPCPPLKFKLSELRTLTDYAKNYGFEILNGKGEDIIQSVMIKRQVYISIVTSENPTGLELTYAKKGWNYGDTLSGGNLCDSQGDKYTITIQNKIYRCDNWCPIFFYNL